ncbi:Glycosyl hydrolase family 28 protein [Rutstroemia sp. NJR-2017a WRK4]|nr:Glycosyl hydrolase family 28 protein [Rutstroemia sp. NJR-2017a WRK4]
MVSGRWMAAEETTHSTRGAVLTIRIKVDGLTGLDLRSRKELPINNAGACILMDISGLTLRNLKILNPVAWVFSIGGSNVQMYNTFINARSMDGFPFNTDGVDLSASNVLIDTFEIHNGDDVINISPPATNVTMRNVIASGTHGLSVSCSSGTGGNYTFENALVYDSLMAARFKGVLGETCNVSDVTWRNIEVRNVSFPIHFIENYYDQEKSAPNSSTSAIAAYAKNFSWKNITGSVSSVIGDGSCITDPCWYATLDESPSNGLYLLCNDHAHCENFRFDAIDLTTAGGEPAGEVCTGLAGVEGMGVACVNGTITKG